jgi:hypothetical protein
MGAEPSRLGLVGLRRLPIGGMPPAFRLFHFFERVADGAGCFYLAGGAGGSEHWGGMGNEFAGWSKGKPKTALTAARGFCKLRKSWSKVRFRSETKPERRRSAPGPENQIPIPIEHAHQSRRQLRL